jgi:ZIP family zinc transporter
LGEEALGEAALYGLGTAVPLVAGALVGLRWQLPRAALAALMAFGAGTMIAAVTTELFAPAFEVSGGWRAGSALLAGTLVYVVADRLIEVRLGAAALGWALMLGALLDGIPENLALGATLEESGGVVLLVAIALGNTPEAISGAAKMRDQHGMSHRSAALIWAATGVVLVVVTITEHHSSVRRWRDHCRPGRLPHAGGVSRRRLVGRDRHVAGLPPCLRPGWLRPVATFLSSSSVRQVRRQPLT